MTTDQKISVLTRMRELLADPARVVLDPENLFETADGGPVWAATERIVHDPTCRMCFVGSAYYAVGMTATTENLVGEILDLTQAKMDTRGDLHDHTDALAQGCAVEVVDACLEDLRSVPA